MRLHMLHKKLVGYATIVGFGEEAASKIGIKPSQQQHFKGLTLDLGRVYRSISVLSRGKQGRMLPYVCAMQIASIWS
ncbi:hypothetical protein [Edaphobacter modestus]|uniref:hypothetical protein n=1 Tax=Edaphobacter modestus TaxID=388466 RepID=UPI00102ACB82|nr:hypothetical protein [Edaphobacter modestus]